VVFNTLRLDDGRFRRTNDDVEDTERDLLPMPDARSPLELQLNGYRLTTAEITYHLPDHPGILQSFIWQHYDIAPQYPELHKFLDFWVTKIEGKLHTVHVARQQLIGPGRYHHGGEWQLH
jgi:uncharacterized protein Usg